MVNEPAICAKCVFFSRLSNRPAECKEETTPYSDFVFGRKLCKDINKKGDCTQFKRKQEER